MFRGHIDREIRARAVFMSEISGHDMEIHLCEDQLTISAALVPENN